MSLKGKVVITLIVVITFYATFNYFILNRLIYPTFSALEEHAAIANLARVEETLKNELQHLSTINKDWAHWDDTYAFALTGDPSYIAANLTNSTLFTLNLNVMLFINTRGELIWGAAIDLVSEQTLPLNTLPVQPLEPDSRLLQHDLQRLDQSGYSGLIATRYGPMLISGQPMLTNEGTGPIAGTMIIGRILNEPVLAAYHDRTKVDFLLTPLSNKPMSAHIQAETMALAASEEPFVLHDAPQTLHASNVLKDVYGAPAFLLHTSTPKDITAIGARTVHAALLALLVAGLIDLIVIWLLLNRFFIHPLALLKNHILAIRAHGVEKAIPLRLQRRDEIGVLSNEFDTMVHELTSTRRQLLDQSFKAGMAETTAGMLHNLRNALVPLTYQLDEMTEACMNAPGAHLEQALDQLAAPEVAAERRVKLADYAKLTTRQLIDLRTELADQLSAATRQIEHIETILSDQEQLACAEPVLEVLCLRDVVNEAVQSLSAEAPPGVTISLDDSLTTVGSVNAYRFALVQVFSNLLFNASESIQRTGQAAGHIALKGIRQTHGNQSMIQILVIDNGAGIDPTALTAIFQRGYSSKRPGKGGLGLHWCANAIAAMGGRLQAYSDGPSHGAQISVMLPETATS